MTKIYKVGRLENQVDVYPEDVYKYGDVTEMTQGQFNQYLEAQRFRLLGEHHGGITNYDAMADAISPTSPVNIGSFPEQIRQNVSKFMRRVSGLINPAFPNFNGTQKKPANTMGSVLTEALKPIINWIFSIMIPKAAPFFIHVYMDNPYAGSRLLAKKAKQTAILQKIAAVTGTPYENLKASVKSALYGILGKSPKDWFDDMIMANVTVSTQTKPVSPANTAVKNDKMGPGTPAIVKSNKIGNPAAAIVPFIPLILGGLTAVVTIASKLLENLPDMINKDQLSEKTLNDAAPPTSEQGWFEDLTDLLLGSNSGSSSNTGTQYPQLPGQTTTSQQSKQIPTGLILGGAGLLLGGYFLFKK